MGNTHRIAGYRAIKNRVTGELVTEPTPVYAEDISYQEVHPDQPLLRYMDFFKFEDMLKTQTLYFCRADKFADPLEGTVSEEEVHGTSASDMALAEQVAMAEGEYEKAKAYEKVAKGCTFVNCWHINHEESQQMWDAYTSSPESVLVVTTVQKLRMSLEMPVIGAGVTYLSGNSPRTDFGNRSLFFYKDEQYTFEKEYRLLIDLAILGGESIEKHDIGRKIPINLETMVQYIQPHPNATAEVKEKLGALVSEYLPFMQSA